MSNQYEFEYGKENLIKSRDFIKFPREDARVPSSGFEIFLANNQYLYTEVKQIDNEKAEQVMTAFYQNEK